MNKDIKFTGYSAVPDDYIAPDGALAASLNLICEDNQLKPIPQPTHLKSLEIDGITYDPLFIHKVPGNRQNLIMLAPATQTSPRKICWLPLNSSTTAPTPILQLADTDEILKTLAVANALILTLKSSIQYILWNPDKSSYSCLGSHIPFPELILSVTCTTTSKTTTLDVPDNYNNEGTKETSQRVGQALLANFNTIVADKSKEGHFTMPFLARYALRLYDGSHTRLSPPILLGLDFSFELEAEQRLKNLKAEGYVYQDSSGALKFEVTAKMPDMQLKCTFLSGDYQTEANQNMFVPWGNIVSAIDIFVSAPIYTYDPKYSKIIGFSEHELNNSFRIQFPDRNDAQNAINNDIINTANFYYYGSFNLVDGVLLNGIIDTPTVDLSNLPTRQTLKDTAAHSHDQIYSSTAYEYNSRLIIADIHRKIFPGFNPAIMVKQGIGDTNIHNPTYEWWVTLKTPSKTCIAHYGPVSVPENQLFKPNTNTNTSVLPASDLFISYPNANAQNIYLKVTANSTTYFLNFPLRPHPFLDIAYFFCRKDTGQIPLTSSVPTTTTTSDIADSPNALYVSEVNNPFFFPTQSMTTVGSGSIDALSAATKALSQGQFGQFPLYAFTSDGIWALEVSQTGTFSARQPVSRDICVNTHAITQLDSSVAFPSDRGIMLISGSSTTCISDAINSETPFDILSLHAIDTLHYSLNHPDPCTCIPTVPFTSEYLRNCRMAFDYIRQRLLIFHPDYRYAFLFSLKSQQWGMTFSNLTHTINSYPQTLALNNDNFLVDISAPLDPQEPSDIPVLLVTRPLKLDLPDTLKTIRATIIRGNFPRGTLKTILYGSRDLIHWHPIASSIDHTLRGFSGTPYKFFRLACIANLTPGQYISSASINFIPRLTNQLR